MKIAHSNYIFAVFLNIPKTKKYGRTRKYFCIFAVFLVQYSGEGYSPIYGTSFLKLVISTAPY